MLATQGQCQPFTRSNEIYKFILIRPKMKQIYLVILFFSISVVTFGQKPSDFELWSGAAFKLKINKKLSFGVQEQLRFNDTISALNKSFTEVGLKYKFNGHFSVEGSYRYIARPNRSNQHRATIDGNYSWDKKGVPLSFNYRLRYQHLFAGKGDYIRNKVEFGYNLSKLVDPFISYEIFFRLNGKNEFRVSRFTVGLDWRIIKPLHASVFYRLQDDIFIKTPERRHIFGVMLNYKLSLKK